MTEKRKLIILGICLVVLYILLNMNRGFGGIVSKPFESIKDALNGVENPGLVNVLQPNDRVTVKVVDEENAVIDVVKSATPAVVSVVRTEEYFDSRRGPIQSEDSIGTGFIVDGEQGYIFTNKHVVDDEEVTYSVVIGENEARYEVAEITRSPIYDFAILKIDTEGNKLPFLTLGDSDHIQVGQTVIAIGNALGEFGNSATKGIVSGLGRGIIAQSGLFGETELLEDVIQTDAALNPGNSGGPLLNIDGQVIGINVAISQGAENIGFAIPVNGLKATIDEFKTSGKITRPFLGVEAEIISKELSETENIPAGAYILRVVADSPASKAGIRRGDIITQIGGIALDDDDNTLSKVVLNQPTDRDIEIIIDRDGERVTVKARLQSIEQ
ncbi:MAG: hypothetical protein QG570_62 [Patescibacteria group bacterium]|nr:hypothetical protein [Patescibacteria group bacterium]